MSKFLTYIKSNISVFSFFSLVIIITSIYKLITIDTNFNWHIDPRLIFYFAILFALIVLLFDRVLKKIFSDRKRLNVIQLLISVAFIIIVYIKYFT